MTIKPTPLPPSFPAHTYAKLSPSHFLHANLSANPNALRPSGRTPSQARSPSCTTSSISHANGSAVVRLGDTSAVCSVQAEILLVGNIADWRPKNHTLGDSSDQNEETRLDGGRERKRRKADEDEMARLNLLVPNVDLATGCSPAYLPGGPPSTLAQSLSHRIVTLLHSSHLLSIDDLRIWHYPTVSPSGSSDDMDTSEGGIEDKAQAEVKALWTLHIDVLFLSLDGNPFDVAWASVLAALRNTCLPLARWDTDQDTVLCNPDISQARKLSLQDFPVAMSFGVFTGSGLSGGKVGKWMLVDMDDFEESICKEEGTAVVRILGDGQTEIVRIEKSGGVGIGIGEMRELIRLAGLRWKEWVVALGLIK